VKITAAEGKSSDDPIAKLPDPQVCLATHSKMPKITIGIKAMAT
jgi:hypothetical protein